MFKSLPFLVLVCTACVLFAATAMLLYNGIVRARHRVMEGWSGIEVQLKRRATLVPNLVEIVRAHTAHETAALETLARARAADDDVAERAAAEDALGLSVADLIADAEATPALRTNESYRSLRDALAEIERDLHMARRYFNATARDYNTRIETVPTSLLASKMALRPYAYFEVETATDRAPPVVSLESSQ